VAGAAPIDHGRGGTDMSRLDWFVLKRVGSRIAVTILVFFGLIILAEALDTWRFTNVAQVHGLPLAIVMVIASGARWAIKTLPVTVLLGAIIGLIDLKVRHELTVIKSSGRSIWRIIAAPTVAIFVLTLGLTALAETWSTSIVRQYAPMPPGEAALLTPRGEVWLEQRSTDGNYIMMARGMDPGGSVLRDVTIFPLWGDRSMRIVGQLAELRGRTWILPEAQVTSPDRRRRTVVDYTLPTTSSAAEIALKVTSLQDVTFFELYRLIEAGIADPDVRAAAVTRFLRLLSMPLTLVGSLFIAFAFTAGYRRSDRYGRAVLYGVVLGFIVFIVSEMSERAGSGGVLNPLVATLGPAFVAIVIGVTVLLYREDGRT
jgi:lipopolysaccharide export system permease protein